MAYKLVNYPSLGLWFECQHVKQHTRLHLSLGTRSLPALLHQTRAATAVASGMATEATRMVLKHDVEGEWFQYTIEIYWDYWRVLKVWMEGQAFQLTDVPWYPRPTFWHSSSSICSVATWTWTGNGFCPWPSLGAPRNVLQNPASHRRKTSKNIEKLCPSSGNYPIRPVSMEMASTCLDKDPQIHHHPSSSPHHPLIPCLVPQFHHFHFLLLPGSWSRFQWVRPMFPGLLLR